MKNNEINALLKKVDELRALFVLGQKVIPFLEEIFVFVSDIQPLLDDINQSITDNLKRMPSASKQLSKVTEATELATNEIMDLVDGILFNVETISSNLNKISKVVDLQSEKTVETLEILYSAINDGVDVKQLLPELRSIIDNMNTKVYQEKDQTVANTKEIIKTIQLDSSSIMMSLQVQDITSQQIAAVNKLLETLQGRLESILQHFRDSDLSEMALADEVIEKSDVIRVSKLHREIAFDPNAVDAIANKGFKQNEVDEYVRQAKIDEIENENNPTSQDDIDKIFESNFGGDQNQINGVSDNSIMEDGNIESSEFEVQEIPAELISIDDDEAFSQEDIDKMFS